MAAGTAAMAAGARQRSEGGVFTSSISLHQRITHVPALSETLTEQRQGPEAVRTSGRLTGTRKHRRHAGAMPWRVLHTIGPKLALITSSVGQLLHRYLPRTRRDCQPLRRHALRSHGSRPRVYGPRHVERGAAAAWSGGLARRLPPARRPLGAAGAGEAGGARHGQGQAGAGDGDWRGV